MPVPQNPTIKITFDGLLVFTFDYAERLCEIGVLKVVGHTLRINRTITDAAGSQASQEIANDVQSGDISIAIPERDEDEGVIVFHDDENPSDPQDFQWIVDIEDLHKENHPDGLRLKKGFPLQSIFVRQGLFYTAKQITVSLVSPSGTGKEIKIASPVGCNLYMKEGEEFVLSYGRGGEKLEITAETGVKHEITILNTPEKSQHQGSGPIVHFPFFYDFAVEVGSKERFNIVRTNADHGDPDRPCPTILLGTRAQGLTTGHLR